MEIDIAARLEDLRAAFEAERPEDREPYHVRLGKELAQRGGGYWPRHNPNDLPDQRRDWRDDPPE